MRRKLPAAKTVGPASGLTGKTLSASVLAGELVPSRVLRGCRLDGLIDSGNRSHGRDRQHGRAVESGASGDRQRYPSTSTLANTLRRSAGVNPATFFDEFDAPSAR